MFQHVKNHLKDLNSGMEPSSEHGVALLLHSTILSSKEIILLHIAHRGQAAISYERNCITFYNFSIIITKKIGKYFKNAFEFFEKYLPLNCQVPMLLML